MNPGKVLAGVASMRLTDWLLVSVYTGGLVLLGLVLSRRHFRPVDYFLASREARWPAIGLALLASNMSSCALVGLAGGAYAVGIAVYDYEWTGALILIFFCFFLLPQIIRSQIFTMPEFLERRYDRRVRVQFALLTLLLNLVVDAAGVLYSGALVCRLLFPDWPLWLIVALLAGAAGLYTTAGGLRAVIYTEAVQAVVLLAAALTISVGAFARAGGWHAVMTRVDPAALSLIRPADDPGVPWPGLLLGIPLLGFYYWCTNQSMVQRVLAAKDLDHARWGALFAGLLKLPVLFLIVLPGICARLIDPTLARADLVYPTLIFQLLPSGFVGLVVAAFIASTMVAIASLLNSASTLVTMDVVRPLAPALSETGIVRVGRWSTVGFLLLAVLWAPQLVHFPSLWQYLQAVLAYVIPPVVALFLVGMFWSGATADAAALTMRLGALLGAGVFVGSTVLHLWRLHFLYAAPLLTLLDVALLVLVSRLGRERLPAGDERAATLWQSAAVRLESARLAALPLWQDYRLLAAGLLGLTAGIVFAFR